MSTLLSTSIAFFLLSQSLAGAYDVHSKAPRASPREPPYTGKPEDFTTAANAPLWPYQRFVTEPDFHPPVLQITKQPTATDGLLVFAPLPFILNYPDRFAGGLIMDQLGNPIWHSPVEALGNLEVGGFEGVLKFWTGGIGGNFIDAHGFGSVTVLDKHYNQSAVFTLNDGTFKSGDSLQNKPQPSYIDIHENLLTTRGTLLVTAYNSTPYDLSSVGGPKDGWLLDSLVYEIELKTGKTIFRWSSVEHVDELPLNGSHQLHPDGTIIDGGNATHPWDYFLTNSVYPDGDGYILSSRHYWSAIRIDSKGNVTWNLNGKTGGDFKFIDQNTEPSTFSWQHHIRANRATENKDITITMFNNNNHGLDNGTAPSTGLEIYLDLQKKTARTVKRLIDPQDQLYADSQGTYEDLTDNHTFIGYGQIPKFKEFDENGKVVMDARFGVDNQVSSYRSFLINASTWSAAPHYAPKIAATHLENGTVVVSMSWNGATPDAYDSWLINATPARDRPAGSARETVPRTGFESNVTLAAGTQSVVVWASKGSKPASKPVTLRL
ncbi:MAG: hypothetical protein Q9170_004515 [Blastenia crenularia]